MNFPFEKLDWIDENGEIKFWFPDFTENFPLFEFSRIFRLAKNPKSFAIGSI